MYAYKIFTAHNVERARVRYRDIWDYRSRASSASTPDYLAKSIQVKLNELYCITHQLNASGGLEPS